MHRCREPEYPVSEDSGVREWNDLLVFSFCSNCQPLQKALVSPAHPCFPCGKCISMERVRNQTSNKQKGTTYEYNSIRGVKAQFPPHASARARERSSSEEDERCGNCLWCRVLLSYLGPLGCFSWFHSTALGGTSPGLTSTSLSTSTHTGVVGPWANGHRAASQEQTLPFQPHHLYPMPTPPPTYIPADHCVRSLSHPPCPALPSSPHCPPTSAFLRGSNAP